MQDKLRVQEKREKEGCSVRDITGEEVGRPGDQTTVMEWHARTKDVNNEHYMVSGVKINRLTFR